VDILETEVLPESVFVVGAADVDVAAAIVFIGPVDPAVPLLLLLL
jgi:hypothetical protein